MKIDNMPCNRLVHLVHIGSIFGAIHTQLVLMSIMYVTKSKGYNQFNSGLVFALDDLN
jgi:hypothetical protein